MTEIEDLEHQLQCFIEARQALGLQISQEPFCSKAQLNIKKCRDINRAETEMYFRVLKLK